MEFKISNKVIKLNDLIKFTLNTDSLSTLFEFILMNNKNTVNDVNDVKIRCSRIEEEQKKTEEIFVKLSSHERKISEILSTMYSYNSRFMDMDSKLIDMSQTVNKVEELGKSLEENLKKFNALEDNFNLLNKLTEENIKNIDKTSDNIHLLKETIALDNDKYSGHLDNINKNFQSFSEKYTSLEKNINTIEKKLLEYGDYFLDVFGKLKIHDNNENLSQRFETNIFDENDNINSNNLEILNNFNTMSHFTDKIQINETENGIKNFNPNKVDLNRNLDDIDRSDLEYLNEGATRNSKKLNIHSNLKKNIDNFTNKEVSILKSNFDISLNIIKNEIKALYKDLNNKIIDLKSLFINQENYIDNKNSTSNNNDNEKETRINLPIFIKDEIETYESSHKKKLVDNAFKINDNKISITLLDYEERIQDIENILKGKKKSINNYSPRKNTSVLINKPGDLINQSYNIEECSTANANINILDQYEININNNELLEDTNLNVDMIRAIFENTIAKNFISSKIKEEFQKLKISNEYNSAILNDLSRHNDDINKIYESILTIRKTLAEKEENILINPIITNMSNLEESLNEFKNMTEKRIIEIDKITRKTRDFVDESHKGLIELKFDDSENSLKNFFKTFLFNLRQISEKADKNGIRLDNLSVELLARLKKDLQGISVNNIIFQILVDSQKLFDDFKEELKNRLIVLDDQIKAKVDIYNFDEYGKKLDVKITNEFSKKIDRNDLKKNNTFITKKIENLQDKISKTLIDALTDIQLEEAPLIVKSNVLGNKCGSCNQVLTKDKCEEANIANINYSSPRSEKGFNTNIFMPMSPINGDKISFIRNIQEISNNMGSYSKILSNYDEENVNELTIDLKSKANNVHNMISLPEVINKRGINLNSGQLKKHFRNKSTIINSSKLIRNNFTTNSSNIFANNSNNISNYEYKPPDYLKNYLENELESNKNIKGENLIKAVDKFHNQNGK